MRRAVFEKLTLELINARAVLVPLRRPVVSKVGLFKDWPLILGRLEKFFSPSLREF